MAEEILGCEDAARERRVEILLEISRIRDREGLHLNTRPVAAALEAIEAASEIASEIGGRAEGLVAAAFADYHYRAEMPEREFPLATSYTERAIHVLGEVGDFRSQADAVHKLGLIHFQRREVETARELFDRSLELDRAAGARAWLCGEYERHMAMLEGLEGVKESSIVRFRKSLECRIEAGAIDASLFAAVSLGSALVRIGRPAAAREPLAYALEVATRIDSPVGRANAQLVSGRMHEALGDSAAARTAYLEALRIAATVGSSLESSAAEALERLPTSTP